MFLVRPCHVPVVLVLLGGAACGSDAARSDAQKRGVGAECSDSLGCSESGQTCLAFKGGYCGVSGCTTDAQCPAGSACVTHSDGKNYCFLTCTDKAQCNASRSAANEANCSSSVTFVGGKSSFKACVPPS